MEATAKAVKKRRKRKPILWLNGPKKRRSKAVPESLCNSSNHLSSVSQTRDNEQWNGVEDSDDVLTFTIDTPGPPVYMSTMNVGNDPDESSPISLYSSACDGHLSVCTQPKHSEILNQEVTSLDSTNQLQPDISFEGLKELRQPGDHTGFNWAQNQGQQVGPLLSDQSTISDTDNQQESAQDATFWPKCILPPHSESVTSNMIEKDTTTPSTLIPAGNFACQDIPQKSCPVITAQTLDTDPRLPENMCLPPTSQRTWRKKTTPVRSSMRVTTPKRPRKAQRRLSFDAKPCSSNRTLEAAKEVIDKLLGKVLKVLDEGKLLYDFVLLLKVIANGRLPCNNIAFLLLLERARFANQTTSTAMYYWPETLKFWKIVYKILHGKAIRLFSGMKNAGQVTTGETTAGQYDPLSSVCNFAVPEVVTLNKMTEQKETKLPNEIPPGIILTAIDLASKQEKKEYVLCVDGKKVAPGLNNKYGDIDLWGHEPGVSLAETKARLQKESNLVDSLMDQLLKMDGGLQCGEKSFEALENLRQLATILSNRVSDARHIVLAQSRHLDKLQKLSVSNPDNKQKYDYSMSFTQTNIFQAKRFISSTLQVISQICEMGSVLNGSRHFSRGQIDPNHQGNMVCLQEPSVLPESLREATFIKQRTPEWFALRKLSPVTGSSLHKGIGLGTLKEQREHCDHHISGSSRPTFTAEIQERLDHGMQNEEHAVATLVGSVLPFMFPASLGYVEDGARFIQGQTKYTLIEVSSDGSLQPVEGTHVGRQSLFTVEIKCPFPNKNVLPVHYKLPKYYVCQLLAEMVAHGTNVGLYITYSKESTTVCKVHFDEELWEMVLSEVEMLYGGDTPIRLKKRTDTSKAIMARLDSFIKTNVEFLIEVPSCTSAQKSELCYTVENLPYTFPIELHNGCSIQESDIEPETLCQRAKESIKEGHRLSRKKATEILAFVLSDTDRIWTPEQPHHMPIAYALKGSSIKVSTVARMVDQVRIKCEKAGVNIACESYDGQWYPLVIRDSKGAPLTRLQLQKDVWKEALSLTKPKLLQYFRHLFVLKGKINNQDDNSDKVQVHKTKEGVLEMLSHGCSMGRVVTSWTHKTHFPMLKPQKQGKKKRRISSLHSLCMQVVTSTYPKHLLSVRYAQSTYPDRLESWESDKPLKAGTRVRGIEETVFFYSFVEQVHEEKYRPKLLDPSHLLVNCRVKSTKDGFEGVDPKAFIAVAEVDPTIINRAIIADALDKQSVAIAERVFSEPVETKMKELGFHSTATFVGLIRNWYQGIDKPGLQSIQRIQKFLDFKKWLLEGVKFDTFPPPGRHVKGIPVVMWEGFLQNIDTRIQLYSVCQNKTYNQRSLGTLAVESFFSDLTDIEPTKMGCPKAIHIPRLMGSVTELNHYRHDPCRSFQINTSRAKVYPYKCLLSPDQENQGLGSGGAATSATEQLADQSLILRDHPFDSEARASKKRRQKKVTLSKPDEPVRGAVTLRSLRYKINEEKVNPVDRLAIPNARNVINNL